MKVEETDLSEDKTEVSTEHSVKETPIRVWDLGSKDDQEQLVEKLNAIGNYFKPELDMAYKIILTSPKIEEKKKEWADGKISTQYELQIIAKGQNGFKFEGIWGVGVTVLNEIAKNYKDLNTTYTIKKTKMKDQIRYSVISDF